MNAEPKRCEAQCDEPPAYWHTHPCNHAAKYERDGRPVCGIHARAYDRRGSLNWKPR